MAKKEDDRLQLRLENKYSSQGLRAPCRIRVEVYNGNVTVSGVVQYEYQKRSAILAARSMDGVQSVVDRLKVETPVHQWDDEPIPGHGTPPTTP